MPGVACAMAHTYLLGKWKWEANDRDATYIFNFMYIFIYICMYPYIIYTYIYSPAGTVQSLWISSSRSWRLTLELNWTWAFAFFSLSTWSKVEFVACKAQLPSGFWRIALGVIQVSVVQIRLPCFSWCLCMYQRNSARQNKKNWPQCKN